MSNLSEHFLAGVIEGFYGRPWTQAERFELFDWMAAWGLNTYFYAPKDDLKQRALWREPYSPAEQEPFQQLIRRCKEHNLRFIYGLSPGLDICYGDAADLIQLKKRFEQMRTLGCERFALLFDDVPNRLDGPLASAQASIANALSREGYALLFCPTAYCSRMAAKPGAAEYLSTLGRELAPQIEVFWTGPEIISREITVTHVRDLQLVLRRKPLIWDNLHANDYDGRRFYCGPYAGRTRELRHEVAGVLMNPNNEFPLNYVPLRTFARFIRGEGPWDARKAYVAAMREWQPRFATVGQPPALEDLILFADCYYLPHEEGPEAEVLFRDVEGNETRRLRDLCARMAEVTDRELFYALSRRVWDLREELDLLIGYSERQDASAPYRSDFHLPGTYRGGIVARLQRLLSQQPDGNFRSTK